MAARKILISKKGNTTVVVFKEDGVNITETLNYNAPADTAVRNDVLNIHASEGNPSFSVKFEDLEDNLGTANIQEYSDAAAENFFFCESVNSDSSLQDLMDILNNGDRDVKYIELADGETYEIEPEEDRNLLLAITFVGDDATASVKIPFQVDVLNPEYKVLVYEKPEIGVELASGINGTINYIYDVANVPVLLGNTSHKSKDNSIALLKLIEPELLSITYQSKFPNIPITQNQLNAIQEASEADADNPFVTRNEITAIKEFVIYIGGQDNTGLLSTVIKKNTTEVPNFVFTRLSQGLFSCPQFDPTKHIIIYNTTYPKAGVFFSYEDFNIDGSKLINTLDGTGSNADNVFEYGGILKIEEY